MSKFTQEEVDGLEKGGNAAAQKVLRRGGVCFFARNLFAEKNGSGVSCRFGLAVGPRMMLSYLEVGRKSKFVNICR